MVIDIHLTQLRKYKSLKVTSVFLLYLKYYNHVCLFMYTFQFKYDYINGG